jgi:glc operon protein GlcG
MLLGTTMAITCREAVEGANNTDQSTSTGLTPRPLPLCTPFQNNGLGPQFACTALSSLPTTPYGALAMITKPAIQHEDAMCILLAAQAHATEQKWPVSIAVSDEGGHLLAFIRLAGANLASARIAQSKAHTAVMMKRETRLVEEMINAGRTAFLSAPHLDGMLEGGIAIIVEGHCIGAVGVSGVKASEDAQIAQTGITAWLAGIKMSG